jgi:hypothetical protein
MAALPLFIFSLLVSGGFSSPVLILFSSSTYLQLENPIFPFLLRSGGHSLRIELICIIHNIDFEAESFITLTVLFQNDEFLKVFIIF